MAMGEPPPYYLCMSHILDLYQFSNICLMTPKIHVRGIYSYKHLAVCQLLTSPAANEVPDNLEELSEILSELRCCHDVDVEVNGTVGDEHHASTLVGEVKKGIHLRRLVDVNVVENNKPDVLGQGQDHKDG